MVSKQSALEWLTHAYHDLQGAKTLFQAGHYTDTISYILQQAIEKTLKAIQGYKDLPIKKTHNLIELYELSISDTFKLDEEEMAMIALATTYYIKQRYPSPHKKAISQEEIKQVLDFTDQLFNKVCTHLNISMDEIKALKFT